MDDLVINEEEVPDHILPLFFTNQTQEIFFCKVDDNVTEESPLKIIRKEDILQDFRDRAAISDFHPAKKIVENYPYDEMLVVYDPVFAYGQNFYLVIDDVQKDLLLKPQQDHGYEALVEEVIEVRHGLRTPKPWISLGSEQEVAEEAILPTREKLQYAITRPRRMFGGAILLGDRQEDSLKDLIIDCISYEDEAHSVLAKELDKATQHVPIVSTSHAQTDWPCPYNRNVQYVPRSNSAQVNDVIMESDDLLYTIGEVMPRFELALQENYIFNVFVNDYTSLGEEDSTFGSKTDNHFKEYQSFTDFQFSKKKTVSHVQWHPTIKGLIAVSYMELMPFYDRIDNSSLSLMRPSLILIWSFADPIHPLLLLEAPDDIICFQFNLSDPNIICAGCINGQIVLWDIDKYRDNLKNHRTQGQGSQANQNLSSLPSFFNADVKEVSPIMLYCAVSSIEHSHHMAVTDIQWIPDHIEVGRMGLVYENKPAYCSQIITCASDGCVLFWDTRSTKPAVVSNSVHGATNDRPSMFKHLDLSWKPFLKVMVQRLRGSGELSPVKFSISEFQTTIKEAVKKPLKKPLKKPTIGIDFRKSFLKKKNVESDSSTDEELQLSDVYSDDDDDINESVENDGKSAKVMYLSVVKLQHELDEDKKGLYYAVYYDEKYFWGSLTKFFSDDVDSDVSVVEVNFLEYKTDGIWDYPKKPDTNIVQSKYLFFGSVTPSQIISGKGFKFKEDAAASNLYKQMKKAVRVPEKTVNATSQSLHGVSFRKREEGKLLENIESKFYVVTEDGELVYLDWKPTKDIDTGKIVSSQPEFCINAHDAVVNTLEKSPFMRDIFLTVGGWTFSIWKHGVTVGPLFKSCSHESKLTSGHWSPSRPGVFFIGKADGNIDVWDLLDKSHEPFLTQNVTPVPIVSIISHQISSKLQLLAAGDEVGTLHIMEVPWNLRNASSNELSVIENYLEREANRLQYIDNCRSSRPVDVSTDKEDGMDKVDKMVSTQLYEEWEAEAKLDYLEYVEMEKRLLEDLSYSTGDIE